MEKQLKSHRVKHFDIFNALPELSILIFSFLPVRSLLVLRSVCKWFLSIIDDPEFIKFHLHHFPSNALQNRYLNFRNHMRSPYLYLSSHQSTNDEVIVDSICLPKEEDTSYFWPSYDFLDGLVILYTDDTCTFLVWNPSMKKHRWMFPPSQSEDITYVAIGYDSAHDDYKVLVMLLNDAYVYSIKKGSWTAITFEKHKFEGKYYECDEHLAVDDGIFMFETGSNPFNIRSIWFDYGTETFSYASNAPIGIGESLIGLAKLDGGSTVGMWGYDSEGQPSIWALDTRTMSYSKRYKISEELMRDSTLSYVEKNGELMLKYHKNNGDEHGYHMEEIVYDCKMEVIKRHIKIPWSKCPYAYYIESMIFL